MKKQTETKVTKKSLVEVNKYTYKGIDVLVKINRMKGSVSLVECNGFTTNSFTDKKWLFAERGLEYMNSWQDILDAMKHAVSEATKLLEEDLADESAFKDRMLFEASKEMVKRNK